MIEKQVKIISLIKVLAILCLILVPLRKMHQTAYANTYSNSQVKVVKVIASNLNVRAAADISSKIICLVHQGNTFEVIQKKNNWVQIKLSSKQIGWVYNAYITPTENTEVTVKAIVLNVRDNPSLSSQVVGKLKLGTQITVHEEQAGWAKIVSSSGVQGWVYKYYLAKNTTTVHQIQPDTTAPTSRDLMLNSQEPLKGKTIVLDPGHGGIDKGTTSIVGTPEKALTLATAKVVERKLKNAGANVIMTRTNDTYISLQQRADLSDQNHADAFISFHYNWSNEPSVNGLTDFYYQKSKDNPLANAILNEVVKRTGLNNNRTRFEDLCVLRNNSQPSTLIELGFVSNKQDDSVVESSTFRENVAQGVYLGLIDYFSIKK